MNPRTRLALGLLLIPAAACATDDGAVSGSGDAGASAAIRNAAGETVASATANEDDGGVRVRVTASGMTAGSYAVHVHAAGRCDAPGFETAGPHWNPASRQHGRLNPQGPHHGDLPNIEVSADGSGSIEYVIPAASLRGADPMLDGDGAAIVVHAGADDYRTDPSGNSGARIACGIFG